MIPALIVVALVLLSLTFIKQGTIGVVTQFGKYKRVMYPGLNLKLPLIESIYKKISIQHRSPGTSGLQDHHLHRLRHDSQGQRPGHPTHVRPHLDRPQAQA